MRVGGVREGGWEDQCLVRATANARPEIPAPATMMRFPDAKGSAILFKLLIASWKGYRW